MKKLIFLILLIGFVAQVHALDSDKQERLDFGYVLNIKDITTDPATLIPGQMAKLKITIENKANFPLFDIRTDLNLPSQISFYEDFSKRKIAKMEAGEAKVLSYNIIPLPTATEGVYDASFKMNYLNHVATEREENNSFGIVIRTKPNIFLEFDKTDLTQDNNIGNVYFNIVNNEVSNIKFLTVELLPSESYNVLSSSKKYIGDLDSDDFQSVDYKLKIEKETKELKMPIRVYYKDYFNQDYTQDLDLFVEIRDTSELQRSNYYLWSLVALIVIVFLTIGYVVRGRRKRREKKALGIR